MIRPLAISAVSWFCLSSVAVTAAGSSERRQQCERLKATLTYTQEKAPRDLSSVVSYIVYWI
jgi:hypothetical protein